MEIRNRRKVMDLRIKNSLPKIRKYKFEIYVSELTDELAIKVRNEIDFGFRLLTLSKKSKKITFDNEPNSYRFYGSDYKDAWELFEANFKPNQRLKAAYGLLEFINDWRKEND